MTSASRATGSPPQVIVLDLGHGEGPQRHAEVGALHSAAPAVTGRGS